MKEFIKKVLSGDNLNFDEAVQAMNLIMEGKATPAQIAGLIITLKLKGEKVDEVAGFVASMRSHSVKIKLNDENAVDGCGTGGDGSNSFNVSTAAAIITSAAGVTVAKHGNRSVSSKCGSADLLEKAGGKIDPEPDIVKDNINKVGFGFMFAPRFHPAMKHAAVPRKELGVRTIFNILGPMTNPASVKRQVIGVYDKKLMSLMSEVLKKTGSKHVITVHSHDGLDEYSISSPTDYVEYKNGETLSGTINPEDAGLKSYSGNVIAGGDASENLNIFHGILEGVKSPYRDAVLFNSGALIYVAGKAETIKEGVRLAAVVIDKGLAKQKLNDWIKESNS